MTDRKKAYFLSDLHLGARYFSGSKEPERRVVAFLDSIKGSASEIYLLGDILDYWYEYKYVVPRGFIRFFGKLAELADSGVKITWLIGNHDIWIFDYLPSELGIAVADGVIEREILGKTFFLTHGDGVGRMSHSFRFMRSLFRNRICQKLYSCIHPRWTIPFALAWSDSSRGMSIKVQSDEGENALFDFSMEYYSTHPEIEYFIYGHVHSISERQISETCTFITLGEWIESCSYAEFDGNRLKLSKWWGE